MTTPLAFRDRFHLKRFFLGEGASPEPVTLSHRRIFILPSWRGLGFAALIALLLTVSFVYNNNLAYALTFLLASVFFISILHSYQALSGLRLRAGRSQSAFAGECAGFEVHLDNPSRRPRINLQLTAAQADTVRTDIPPGETAHVTLHVRTARRGLLRTGTITVFAYYPLGLFRAWSPIDLDQKTLVYPRPAATPLPFPETPGAAAGAGGKLAGSDDFHGLRGYQPGDSIKQIHWQAYAKGHGIHIKQYSGEKSPELWLDWDQAPEGDAEARLSRLCRWVVDADHAGAPFGFRLPGVCLQPDRGARHREKCLEALAVF